MRLAVAALLLLVAPAAFAQPDPGSVDPEKSARDVVMQLFDGMRARDTAAVRAAFHPEGRLHTVVRDNETHRLEEADIDEFVAALGASPVGWDERIDGMDVHLDDGLATVWAAYRFFVGDRFYHCGIDAFTLVQDSAGWRILQIVDTRRTGCE